MAEAQTATPKRLRHALDSEHALRSLAQYDDSNEETPTQTAKRPSSHSRASETSSQTSRDDTSESQGSAATPSKRRRKSQGLALLGAGAPRFLDGSEPKMLRDMARHFVLVHDEKRFVWPDFRGPVLEHPLKDSVYYSLSRQVWYYEPPPPNIRQPQPIEISALIAPRGPCPSLEQIHALLEEAHDCELNLDGEMQWNCAVHYPLLKLALHCYRGLRVTGCGSASISSEYSAGIKTFASNDPKKVDFCITLRRADHPGIARINREWPEPINHTRYHHFMANPIAISIEIKARVPDEDEAMLQMTVWLQAQFARLQSLVGRQSDNNTSVDNRWRSALDELAFLPAVIVLKHEWWFVAATWDTDRAVLWRKVPLGTTGTPQGICQVIYGMRTLATWAEDTYWPWFQKWALGT